MSGNTALYNSLTDAYKQLDAPFGEFAQASEEVSTRAVETVSPGDAVYKAWDAQLRGCEAARTSVVNQVRTLLDSVEFGGAQLDLSKATPQRHQSNTLINQMQALASRSSPPSKPACRV